MTMWQCGRCGKPFCKRTHYKAHTEKQKICDIVLNNIIPTPYNYIILDIVFKCKSCIKVYKDYYKCKEHVQKCKLIDKTLKKNKNINEYIIEIDNRKEEKEEKEKEEKEEQKQEQKQEQEIEHNIKLPTIIKQKKI